MKVRCWLILGGTSAAMTLPSGRALPDGSGQMLHMLGGAPPDASFHQPGDWFYWRPAPDMVELVLVCADVPLA